MAVPAIPTVNAPSTAGMTTKVVKGSLWTLAGQVAPLFVSLITTPLVIRMLGAEGYGVLILVGLIPTYLNFADFGMSMASTKFASEAYAAGDLEKEARIVRTAALIALCSSLPFAIALIALSGWLVTLFNVPQNLQAEGALALKIAAVTFVVNFLTLIFNTPQLTRLRMDLNTFVTAAFRVLGLIATPIMIYLGFGIVGAVTVLLVASLMTLVGHMYISGRLLPDLSGLTFDRSITPLVRFGLPLAIGSIAMLLLINAEKIILTRVSDVTALAYYSVAFNLANVAAFMGGALLQSLVPAFSQLLAPEKREQFMGLLFRVARFNLIVIFPLIAGMFVFSEQFIRLWAGEEFARESTAPFRILALGLFFYLFSFIPNALLLASGRSDVQARLYWLELLPYIAVTILLVTYYGAIGAALAWAVRVISDCALMSYFGLRSVSVGVRQMASSIWSIGLVGILFIVPMAITMSTDFGIGALAGAFVVTGSLYVVAVGYFLMEKAELAVLFEKLHRKGA